MYLDLGVHLHWFLRQPFGVTYTARPSKLRPMRRDFHLEGDFHTGIDDPLFTNAGIFAPCPLYPLSLQYKASLGTQHDKSKRQPWQTTPSTHH
jgi:hypothetical protein